MLSINKKWMKNEKQNLATTYKYNFKLKESINLTNVITNPLVSVYLAICGTNSRGDKIFPKYFTKDM